MIKQWLKNWLREEIIQEMWDRLFYNEYGVRNVLVYEDENAKVWKINVSFDEGKPIYWKRYKGEVSKVKTIKKI